MQTAWISLTCVRHLIRKRLMFPETYQSVSKPRKYPTDPLTQMDPAHAFVITPSRTACVSVMWSPAACGEPRPAPSNRGASFSRAGTEDVCTCRTDCLLTHRDTSSTHPVVSHLFVCVIWAVSFCGTCICAYKHNTVSQLIPVLWRQSSQWTCLWVRWRPGKKKSISHFYSCSRCVWCKTPLTFNVVSVSW